MHSRILTTTLAAAALAALAFPVAGCAGRRPAPRPRTDAVANGRSAEEIRAGFAAEKKRTPHLPMLSQEAAHAAMPDLFKKGPMPTLCLVGGHQPRTMEAVLAQAKAMRREGDLDPKLLNDVFWSVSSANDCFY
jgi:hypothetical protein